jgi:hypothetical protein
MLEFDTMTRLIRDSASATAGRDAKKGIVMRKLRHWLTGSAVFMAVYLVTFATVAWGLSAPLIAQLTGVAAASAATGIAFPAGLEND